MSAVSGEPRTCDTVNETAFHIYTVFNLNDVILVISQLHGQFTGKVCFGFLHINQASHRTADYGAFMSHRSSQRC